MQTVRSVTSVMAKPIVSFGGLAYQRSRPRLAPFFKAMPRVIGEFLQEVFKRLVLPLTVIVVSVWVYAMSLQEQPAQQSAKVTLPALRVEKPFETTIQQPALQTPDVRLARFHENAQVFENEPAAAEGLADALNIPLAVVTDDLNRAIDLAETNTRAMTTFAGTFPLHRDINPRLLAALTPADIPHLSALFDYALSVQQERFTFTSPMASGELNMDADITKLPNNCLKAIMLFTRRSFAHALTATGCRRGDTWSFFETPQRSSP